MLFSSISFLYFFLPLTLLCYQLTGEKGKNGCLFIMSCLFYAWGEPKYLFLMLAQIGIAYSLTLCMEKRRGTRAGRAIFVLSVLIPFASLFLYKYSGFFLEYWLPESMTRLLPAIMPIGISFYTFQLVSYVVDVYRGDTAPQRSLLKLATYVTLFPQLIAGPIVRYQNIEQQLTHRKHQSVAFLQGMTRFTIGLAKKILIANLLGEFVAEAYAVTEKSLALSWGYAAAVTLQIYFDFSGYSDMAIGLGKIFGFTFPENFRYPLTSASVSEFWRRWHMTLGSWFRDYVYIPMGGNRVRPVRWLVNILTVWLLTGLWHGAGWNFILWGLFFAVLLAAEKFVGKRQFAIGGSWLGIVLRHGYVVLAVMISFLIFHAADMPQAWQSIRDLWQFGAVNASGEAAYVLRNRLGILTVAIIGATPLPKIAWERLEQSIAKTGIISLIRGITCVLLWILCTAYLIDGSFNPFLYFRF